MGKSEPTISVDYQFPSKEEVEAYKAKKRTPSHKERVETLLKIISEDQTSNLFHEYTEYSVLERAEALGRFRMEKLR